MLLLVISAEDRELGLSTCIAGTVTMVVVMPLALLLALGARIFLG